MCAANSSGLAHVDGFRWVKSFCENLRQTALLLARRFITELLDEVLEQPDAVRVQIHIVMRFGLLLRRQGSQSFRIIFGE